MKLWRVNFPSLLCIGGIYLYTLSSVFCQHQTIQTPPQKVLDSILQYYSLSNQDSLSLSKRLQFASSFLKGAKSYQQDSLLYIGLMRKTKLLGKAKMYDSAIVYSNRLYDFAEKNGDTIYILKAFTKLGIYHKNNNQLSKAFQYYNNAFKISRLINDSIQAGKSLLQMANIQNFSGDYSGSKNTAIDGLKYIENTSDLRSISGLYHVISVANFEQKNYEEAFKYNSKALTLARDSVSISFIKMSNVLMFKNAKALFLANTSNYKQAISILKTLVSDSIVINDKIEYARVLGNMGYIQWFQNPLNKNSEVLLLKARDIRKKAENTEGLIASNIYLTKYYFNKNKVKALQYAEEAYQNALQLKSLTSIIEALGYIFQLKENTNAEAKVFNETYLKLQEINQSNREIYAVTKYENDKLTNENLVLKAATAKKERQKIIYLFGTIILLLGGGLIFYLSNQRYKREKIRDVFNAETRISKKIHDELANDVYNVMTRIQNNTDNHEVLDKLENIYGRTRDISREHNSFDTGANYLHELRGMLSSYSANDVKIIIKNIDDIKWQTITPEKKIVVHRIIQELMVNMKKHSQAGLVAITFKKKNKHIEISYADNGVGVSKNEILYSSGLQNAENRIKTIHGSFIFESEKGKGFKAKIHFPS